MNGISGLLKNLVKTASSPGAVKEDAVSSMTSDEKSTVTTKGDNSLSAMPRLAELESTHPDLIVHRELVYDLIKDIKDPEKPQTLEQLDVVLEDNVLVQSNPEDENSLLVTIVFVPTVPHCSLASLIGLCLRQKMIECFPEKHKLDIFVKEGTHETADDINKQINDKERIAAAMENPNLRDLVNTCINYDADYG